MATGAAILPFEAAAQIQEAAMQSLGLAALFYAASPVSKESGTGSQRAIFLRDRCASVDDATEHCERILRQILRTRIH